MPSSHLIFCHPLFLLPSIFPNKSVLRIRWPKDWSFSVSPSDEYSGLISFRIDWFYLLEVQGTVKSSPAPQFKSINSSVLSLLYGPTLTSIHDHWKTIALTRWTFVGKVMSLLFNMLSRLVIAFLPRGKCPNCMVAVTICSDFGAQENEVSHCFHYFPIYLLWSDGIGCHDLHFLNVEF